MRRLIVLTLLLTAATLAAPVLVAAPMLFSYQGQITDAGGSPITTPTNTRITILWGGTAIENPSTGKPVYQEDVLLIPDSSGVFQHLIGSGSPTSQCDEDRNGVASEPCVLGPNDFPGTGAPIFVEIRVDPSGTNNLLLPRQQLVSVPFALNAATVNGQPGYTDADAVAAVLAADGPGSTLDADTLDGFDSADLVSYIVAGAGLAGGGTGGLVGLSIAASGVTQAMLAIDSVGSAQIANGTVNGLDIAADSILSTHIVLGAVGTSEILNETITSLDIGPNAVSTSEIVDGSVAGADIADGTVTTADLAADTITAADIAPAAIGTSEIADGSITGADIAGSTVTNSNLSLTPFFSSDLQTTSTTEATLNLGSQRFCALARITTRLVINNGTNNWCRVYYTAPDWFLGARSNGTTEMLCQAVCF